MSNKILHMSGGRSQLRKEGPFIDELKKFGELKVVENGRELSEEEALAEMREADILLTMWGALKVPVALADDPGNVRYILHLTGTCRPYIPIEVIRSGIPVTNWGDAPAFSIAEGAMALLLAVLKDMRSRTQRVANGEWGGACRWELHSGSIRNLRLGLYGCGAIGRRFVEMVRPFGPELIVYDPFLAEMPPGCKRVHSLEDLFEMSEAIAVHAGLSEETEKSVTAQLLAMLPDGGVVINTARGEIIDQAALFAELKSGRLRAGLDVLAAGDAVPGDHEARQWPNLLLTCHDINSSRWPKRPAGLNDGDRIALDNLRRFQDGRPLRFVMDEQRYLLST